MVTVGTDRVGSESSDILEFENEDWEEMDTEEREEACYERVQQMVNWDWEVQ